ncbi:MAG: amidohydrolase family protein [Hyphomicrobiales bacterium]
MTTPIIDAHHHIWRKDDLPWLKGPMQPRIFGPYEAIRRDYPIAEYRADLEGTGVTRSVYVQTNWAPDDFAKEAAWVQATADEAGWPHGIVAYCDLMAEDSRAALDQLAAFPLMRGVRMQLHWHENPMYRFAPRPDLMNDERFRRNLAYLSDYDWSFDLQVFESQMRDAAALAHDYPRTTFVLQHAGMLEDLSEEGRARWRDGMALLAQESNIVSKMSGLGTFIHANDQDHIAAIYRDTVSLFGASRCLFGSNFPIEKLWTSYPALVEAHKSAAAQFSADEQRDIFWNTAARVYRIAA